MSSNLGFGAPKPQPKPSKRSTQRAAASQQYDKMKADGLPEYEIYIRIQGKKQWYPVGVISVKRSSQINQAVFANREELVQGAFRIYPVLKKNRDQLEYGYRLKEFKDEPIQLAEEPKSLVSGGLQSAIAQVSDRITGLFKR
ncbi:HHL1-like protein [Leptolyngbya ohadii]|uniref:HHL1-like protein n=1 Tax=Leptolyngbya ohadii TaxID=1962290 RepID=UPI000B5989D3|nr:HHL1-like protein [Leptolyngbya ohadii]